jgi:GMP synthase (glutamine-hydrolysing)
MGNSTSRVTGLVAAHNIAILDAGSQFGGLIDRNIRELGLRTTLLPLDTKIEELTGYDAIVISGGPKSVEAKDAYICDPRLIDAGIPILGICYGLQLLAKLHGGTVGPAGLRQDGVQDISIVDTSTLFADLPGSQQVLMAHGDSVLSAPNGFRVTAQSEDLIAAIENDERKQYGIQFHPEVFQTEYGPDIFRNFLFKITGLRPDYSLDDQENEAIDYIKDLVQDKDVVVFVSGGVDSAVVAALIGKAIPKEKIHAFHVDTGFMRQDESKTVITALENAGIEVTLLDMVELFSTATTFIDGIETLPLNQVTDPQTKRKIIGDTFIQVRQKILSDYQLDEDSVLAQGSLRPDLIESGSSLASSKADTIKTHHNDTEEVRKLRQKNYVVEPLQQMYKDQVRALGKRLGLPESLIQRHPFPGPGLAIRVICSEAPFKLDNHEQLQTNLDSFLLTSGFPDFIANLLPIQTVGVQGDGRSYKYLCAVTGPTDWKKLYELALLIPNHNHSINRVAYLFGDSIDRSSIGITPTHLTSDVLKELRTADAIVTDLLANNNLLSSLSQMPVIVFPVTFGKKGARSIALRPFKTPDFMTGIAVGPENGLPEKVLDEMVNRILKEVPGITRVVLDMTGKPPGTTEWE